VTRRAIQATVERCDRAFASAATMIWASALTAGAVSMSVVIPRAAQSRSVRNAVAGPLSSRQSRAARVHRAAKNARALLELAKRHNS
jgi:hypothetical protein